LSCTAPYVMWTPRMLDVTPGRPCRRGTVPLAILLLCGMMGGAPAPYVYITEYKCIYTQLYDGFNVIATASDCATALAELRGTSSQTVSDRKSTDEPPGCYVEDRDVEGDTAGAYFNSNRESTVDASSTYQVVCENPNSNTCTCAGGTAATGTDCDSNNAEICSSCDPGYHSSGVACLANQCTATQVANSDKAATGSITGVTGDTVTATCNTEYTGGGTATCGTDNIFSSVTCAANNVSCQNLAQIMGQPEQYSNPNRIVISQHCYAELDDTLSSSQNSTILILRP
jgi:hypothetical protein